MRLQKLDCPNCGASIRVDVQGRNTVFCSYCGQQFSVDDGNRTITINRNININKKVHYRHTDDADIIRAKNEKHDRKWRFLESLISPDFREVFIPLVFCFLVFGVMIAFSMCMASSAEKKEQSEIDAGKISAGYYEDLIGQDYEVVVAHFEAAGFENIKLIDLDDSGIMFWKDGEVEVISVGGDTSFHSSDYFYPDVEVVISYH